MKNKEQFLKHLSLSIDLAKRDLEAKYKRSVIGWFWILLTPICLLGIYTFVFSFVLGVEWKVPGHESAPETGYILPFFIGLSIYLLVTDVVNSSTVLYVSKRTYVNKSSFPIWVLWLANLIRAGIHGGVTFLLVLLMAVYQGTLSFVGFIWLFLDLFLVLLFLTGVSSILSSLGPFFGDISEVLRLVMRVLFYATPITYPLSYVSTNVQYILWFNPLTNMIEPLREAILYGAAPSFFRVSVFCIVSVCLIVLAIWMHRRLKEVIPDVV